MSQAGETTDVVVELSANGPYIVKGLKNLRSHDGEELPTRNVVALCRCGASANKPFCDGSHTKVGFEG